jgi:penicillin-binding protein 2B
MTKKIRARSLLIGGVFTLFFVILLVKVYYIQVVEASWLLGQAEQNWETDKVLVPERGSILDRNNKVLAIDAPAYTVSLNPKIINAEQIVDRVVQGLTDILAETGQDKTALANKIRDKAIKKKDDGTGSYAVSVEIRNEGWKIEKANADKVREFAKNLEKDLQTERNTKKSISVGINITQDKKRFYPGNSLAAQLIGYTNKEGQPVLGLEARMDDILKGVPGSMNYETDAKGVELPDSKVSFKPAKNGENVRLTIDKNIQFYIESALAKINDKFHPKSMTAIAVDPKTMEILGMANVPTFDPNQYWTINSPDDFVNHAVASQYEPGSTFKIVTLAATVEENLFNPNEMYQSGTIKVPGRILHDHNDVGWGQISFLDGLKRSSNVAFVKLGYEKLGPDKLESYIHKFGFGEKTNIDIPGEVPGLIRLKYQSDYATATYGQGGVVATALQLTAAYGAIANGGKLLVPHVIKDIVDPATGEVIQTFAPQEVRQVVSPATAKKVTEYLEQVVSDKQIGTGKNAAIEGYRVAGKTGTANIVINGEKGYSPDKWMISFVGYAPAEDPKILVAIIADQPDLGGNYHRGGEVAAPAFKEIVSQTLQYMGIASSKETAKPMDQPAVKLVAPALTSLSLETAKDTAKQTGLTLETLGKGSQVLEQFPKAGTEMGPTQRIYIALQEPDSLSLPDFTGKSLRDTLELCSFLKVNCQTSGEGYVTDQSVNGEGDSKVVTLQLHPMSGNEGSTSTDANASNDKAKVVPDATIPAQDSKKSSAVTIKIKPPGKKAP